MYYHVSQFRVFKRT